MDPEALLNLTFSPQLESALAEVLPSDDPLDAADFDPVAYMNAKFPTEESLGSIDAFCDELDARSKSLNEEILQTVRAQTSAGSSARKDLENGKQSVAELFVKVREIKGKAEQSEQMVHEICRDIKSLDYAKRHLTTTITALKRLQMLVTAVEQLVVMSRERMYAEAANLLEAVTQLLGHFSEYTHIDKVRELSDKVADVRTSLRTQVFDDFNKLSAEDGTPQIGGATFETLTGACAVVDALGPAVRKEMIAWFSNWQFAPYKHTFQPYGECGSLEKTELRYAWFRKLLQAYDDTFAPLFPPSWHVALGVTRDFCTISKAHLDEILDQSRGSLDVALLTHSLQKTVEFEKEMDVRFAAAGDGEGGASSSAPAAAPAAARAKPTLVGAVSRSFDAYMSIYVSLEDKQLDEALGKSLEGEGWTVGSTGRVDDRVFNSSKELFLALKRSFKRGTALQMGNVLIELHVVWAKHLRNYARRVLERLPPMTQPADASAPPQCNLDGGAQQLVCAVINTCEYCSKTTAQLADSIAAKVDDGLKEKVDLETPQEHFQGVITAGMKVLVAALETRVANGFTAMRAVKWETMEEVGEDASPFMAEIVGACREMMPQLGETLNPLYVRFFCDKFVKAFVPRLIGNIYRCKRIGEVGAQQMQIDVGTLRQTLLDLPTLGQAAAANPYTKLVASEMAVAEHILKLVTTPEELLEATVDETRAAGVAVDFEKILVLKGLKAADWTGAEKARDAAAAAAAAATEGGKKIKEAMAAKLRGMGA